MDPEATWRDLQEAYHESDTDRVVDLAQALLHWLDRGGFPPKVVAQGSDQLNDQVTRWACRQLLAEVAHA